MAVLILRSHYDHDNFSAKNNHHGSSRPEATHVAVKESRILGVGGWQSLRLGEPTVSTSGLQIKF